MKRKKRKCRCFEITGKKFSGCKGYIDNGNYFFCSVCHRALTRLTECEPEVKLAELRRK